MFIIFSKHVSLVLTTSIILILPWNKGGLITDYQDSSPIFKVNVRLKSVKIPPPQKAGQCNCVSNPTTLNPTRSPKDFCQD